MKKKKECCGVLFFLLEQDGQQNGDHCDHYRVQQCKQPFDFDFVFGDEPFQNGGEGVAPCKGRHKHDGPDNQFFRLIASLLNEGGGFMVCFFGGTILACTTHVVLLLWQQFFFHALQ